MTTDQPRLLTPFELRRISIRKRTIMAAMSDPGGRVSDLQIAHCAKFPRAGVGLIAVEFACVDSANRANDGAIHACLAAAIREGGSTPALRVPRALETTRPACVRCSTRSPLGVRWRQSRGRRSTSRAANAASPARHSRLSPVATRGLS